jgi:hypothetical protein
MFKNATDVVLTVNGEAIPVKGFDYEINKENIQMENTVQDALDKDVSTKEMQVTVEVPESKLDGDLESEIVSTVPAVRSAKDTNPLCPVCGDPYEARIRLGFNHPVLTGGADKLCMGENDKTDGTPGGLGWLYSHDGTLTSDGL